MPRLLHRFPAAVLLGLFLFSGLLARAQSVRWEPSSGTLAREQISELTLIFQDCEPVKGPPPAPTVNDLAFEPGVRAGSQTVLNFGTGARAVRQSTRSYIYRVRPLRADGQVRIPAITVETDAGTLTVPAAGFTIVAATVGQTGLPLNQIITARFTPPAAPIWAGEVFRLTHTVEVDRRYFTNSILGGPLDWPSTPFTAEEWSKPAAAETTTNGQPRVLITSETRAIAPAVSGPLPFPPATIPANLPTGNSAPFGSIFGGPTLEQFTITTAPVSLQSRPLPTPAPADFSGGVGQFTLTSKIVPEKATLGEPITWTLTLAGTGNWPVLDRLPPRDLNRDFRVVTPRAQKTPVENRLFDASLSEDLVLIPQKPGRYELGTYTLSIFNPVTGAYETLRSSPVTIEISPAPTGPGTAPANPEAAPAAPATPSLEPVPINPPEAMVTLPADPLPTGLLAPVPQTGWPFSRWPYLAALLLPLVLWLALAYRHARRNDPLIPRRQAHAQLGEILSRLSSGVTDADLLAWQYATRTFFSLDNLTPTARDLTDPVWSALWAETERVLYRPGTTLSPDWLAQAKTAWQQAALAPLPATAALRAPHLFPAALAFTLLALASPQPTRAQPAPTPDPLEAVRAYTSADFAKAEALQRAQLATAPTDPALRHNLALALAQQGQWAEAAAHAYVAHLQDPHSPALQRLLTVTQAKSAYRPPVIEPFALRRSVPEWQNDGLLAALLVLLCPAFWVISAYHPGYRRFWRALFALTLVAAIAGLFATGLALRAYGDAAHAETVLIWQDDTLRAVPTELGEQQVTSPLPAGTLARVDKSFLGWRRLVLKDGNTGWVRSEALIGLWSQP
ncbi:MAG: BatD family protein [Verrucomicrobia bacterium]|nr:BatD family protein [Verrucomicrobiota bacterium]